MSRHTGHGRAQGRCELGLCQLTMVARSEFLLAEHRFLDHETLERLPRVAEFGQVRL